jgi:peptidoglycan/LPS O-acetylase OafA/YrhL
MNDSIAEDQNNNFNFLRLLGACLVIFSHSYDVIGKPEAEPIGIITNNHMEASAFGLSIFFFISGFFVTKSALRSPNVFNFVKKRILRIYPALIILVLISVFIAGPILTTLSLKNYFSITDTYRYLLTGTGIIIRSSLPGVFQEKQFYIHGFNASIWSISIEIGLYCSLLIMFLLKFLHQKETFRYVAALIFIMGFALLATHPQLSFTAKRNINLISIFYFGSFAYAVNISRRAMLLLFIAAAILYGILPNGIYKTDTNFLLLLLWSIPVFLFGFSKKINLTLRTDISYGLYILAFPVQQIVFKLFGYDQSVIINLLGTFTLLIPLALASWYLIEKPFIALKRQISSA